MFMVVNSSVDPGSQVRVISPDAARAKEVAAVLSLVVFGKITAPVQLTKKECRILAGYLSVAAEV